MKHIMWMLVVLMSVAAVSASSHGDFTGGYAGYANDECRDRGFGHAVSKWEWNWQSNEWQVDVSEGFSQQGTSVSGATRYSFDWNVGSSGASGIAVKIPGQNVEKVAFGSSGQFTYNGEPGPAHVVFCANENSDVPEFSTVAAGLALSGAGVAFLMLRKRN